jgi:prepilin-type N-terminal cleavage/methylation domain-containing protein
MHRRDYTKGSGFTLVELLVVIGIIAVLISILLPALNRARQSAISIQCMGNLKQIGQAALMYAQEFKGWYPPGHSADFTTSASHEKFLDYGANQPNRFIVSEMMAKYAGYKVPRYDPFQSPAANAAAGYVAPTMPIFFCPADDQLVSGINWPQNNVLNHDPALVGNNGNSIGKFCYWWVANPGHGTAPGWDSNGVWTAGGNTEDGAAAKYFMHMDKNPSQEPGTSPGVAVSGPPAASVDYDLKRPCTPGYDYLRKTSDRHAAEVAICVDRSRSAGAGSGATAGWWFMHGNPSKKSSAWKNELYGDGHCGTVRLDQMHYRWGNPTNPSTAYGW